MIMPVALPAGVFQADAITFYRRSLPILKDISLTITPGECVALVGPNGAGKSSLLKIFSGDLIPQAGKVSLDGMPLSEWKRGELARRRAVLPQHSELLFSFPVLEVVLMGRAPHNGGIECALDYEIAEAAMDAADILALQDRSYDQLSGGEKQRVQLARVLAQIWPDFGTDSGFLLLDEPTSSLDLFHQHAFLQTVRQFAQKGVGVLVVLHDLNLAMQYADRVMVLYHGHSVACDVPEKAFKPELLREVFEIEMRAIRSEGLVRPILVPAPGEHKKAQFQTG